MCQSQYLSFRDVTIFAKLLYNFLIKDIKCAFVQSLRTLLSISSAYFNAYNLVFGNRCRFFTE